MLAKSDLGRRVVVRRRVGGKFTDALGELIEFTDDYLTVMTKRGPVQIPLSDIHRAKVVPAQTVRLRDIAALERTAADSWPAPIVEWLGDWRLRAAGGFTGRANSALPIGDPGVPIDQALSAVVDFYSRQGLPPQVDIPLPYGKAVQRAVIAAGWEQRETVSVQTVALSTLLERTSDRTPGSSRERSPALGDELQLVDEPPPAFLEIIAGRRNEAVTLHPLIAVDKVTFALGYAESGELAAIGRASVVDGWLGLFTIDTLAAYRRKGWALEVMGQLARWGDAHGADRAFLQVSADNAPALALYERLGFTEHHTYMRFRCA